MEVCDGEAGLGIGCYLGAGGDVGAFLEAGGEADASVGFGLLAAGFPVELVGGGDDDVAESWILAMVRSRR